MKKVSLFVIFLLFLIIVVISSSCSSQQPEKQKQGEVSRKLKVYTTIYPLYDFTVNIGGDKVDVQNLVPPGAEPHEWEPTPRDLANLGESDIFIYCGAGLESWIEKALLNVKSSKLVVVDVSKGIELLKADEDEHEHNQVDNGTYKEGLERFDPHIWLDPINAKQIVNNIKEGLVQADPGNKDYFEANAKEYSAKLDLLHKDYLAAMEKAPKRAFVTSHAAFGYLAHRYGLKQIPIRGVSPEVEPTPARIAEIIKMVRKENIDYIFFETLVNPKVSEVIAAEVGAQVLVLNPMGGLTQGEIKAGKNYLSVMRENLTNLKIALGVKDEI